VCGAFEYDFVIITLILSFQALLKWAGATEAGGHPEGLVDSEIARIASKTVTGPEGQTPTEAAVAGLPVDGTTQQKSRRCELSVCVCYAMV
jgi:hypothetical protein